MGKEKRHDAEQETESERKRLRRLEKAHKLELEVQADQETKSERKRLRKLEKARKLELEVQAEQEAESERKRLRKLEKKARKLELEVQSAEPCGTGISDSELRKPKKLVKGAHREASCESTGQVGVSTPVAGCEENTTGGARYWKRIDESKYQQAVEGTKFADNSHYSKGGDAWGDDAADRLGKVKGRGFKKEMAKLKRASWKGCGSIDTGVNSVQFSDWED